MCLAAGINKGMVFVQPLDSNNIPKLMCVCVHMNSIMDEQIELPPGFRFHPTDEELITHYLSPKVLNTNFTAVAIGEADLNKSEPWDLPGISSLILISILIHSTYSLLCY